MSSSLRNDREDGPASAQPLLDGVRVIDLTRILAGPYCTMLLGDLGADVIKIEIPGRGDDTRQWGPPFAEGGESAYYLAANRNKRSLTLNLKSGRGLEILKELIRQGDVVVENFRAGTMAGWGLDYEALQKLRPGLVYCTITGYGYDGPYHERPGYDFIVQGLGGFMSVTGPIEGEPTRAGVAIADLASGMFACSAVLAALFRRQRTGEGQRIDISLLDSQVALMSYVASNFLVSGEKPMEMRIRTSCLTRRSKRATAIWHSPPATIANGRRFATRSAVRSGSRMSGSRQTRAGTATGPCLSVCSTTSSRNVM
jgi:crotonobetainyl-CoA:carnitine CoA-transferase CaiB-like acyl-CoA transferase